MIPRISRNKHNELSSKDKFSSVFLTSFLLICWLTIFIFISAFSFSRGNAIITMLSITFCIFIGILNLRFLKLIKLKLGALLYTYENIYLFKKYIFYFEAIITCALAFLLGMNSALIDFLNITNTNLIFFVNTFLVISSCVGTSIKITLQYTYTIWEATNKKKGNIIPIERLKH